jgi:phosphoribosylanthranilate isomerase
MFKIKICGITSPSDALLAADLGADAIGLNFYEKSPRCVSSEQARFIFRDFVLRDVDWAPRIIGVSVNQGLIELMQLGQVTGVITHQLHGDEPPELIAKIQSIDDSLSKSTPHAPPGVSISMPQRKIIRAFRCAARDLNPVAAYLKSCSRIGALPSSILLDAHAPSSYGGTGQTLDWASIPAQRDKLLGLPLILAGGLTPDNVAEAIATARPDAVDVASGVESSPGKKDPSKLRDFTAAAKSAFQALDKSL